MKYVYSTLACHQKYSVWEKLPSGGHRAKASVNIHGGHGVAHVNRSQGIFTPHGVLTIIEDSELEMLRTLELFNLHEKNKHIFVSDRELPMEKALENLEPKEKSTPLNVEYYEKREGPKLMKEDKKKLTG